MRTDSFRGTYRLNKLLTGIKKKLKVMELINDCVERYGSDGFRTVFAGGKFSSDPTRDIIQFVESAGEDSLKEYQNRLQDLLDDIDEYQKITKEIPSTEAKNTRDSTYVSEIYKKVKRYAEFLQEISYLYEIMHMSYVYGPEPSFVETIRAL